MKCFIYFILIVQLFTVGSGAEDENPPSQLSQMLAFIDSMQNPANCTGLEYYISDMGTGGGFAAHFQLAASQWMRALKLVEFKKPVIIQGKIWRYSEGKECKKSGYDWTCFFEPVSRCQEELLKTGKQIQVNVDSVVLDDKLIPKQFREVGLWRWWGTIQAYMFHRMKPKVMEYVIDKASTAKLPFLKHVNAAALSSGDIHEYYSPSPAAPLAGLHVRHGDKNSDGFKHHSLQAELGHVSKSSECLKDTDHRNSSETDNDNNKGEKGYKKCIVTDNTGVFGPIPVFVASDDPQVVSTARDSGYYTLQAAGFSISTHTGSAGMFTALGAHPELGYNASMEIIADIYMLSRCSTLIGIASSQIFRMAVDLSKAVGRLHYVVAMDHEQLPRMHAMSNKYHLPTPEHFEAP